MTPPVVPVTTLAVAVPAVAGCASDRRARLGPRCGHAVNVIRPRGSGRGRDHETEGAGLQPRNGRDRAARQVEPHVGPLVEGELECVRGASSRCLELSPRPNRCRQFGASVQVVMGTVPTTVRAMSWCGARRQRRSPGDHARAQRRAERAEHDRPVAAPASGACDHDLDGRRGLRERVGADGDERCCCRPPRRRSESSAGLALAMPAPVASITVRLSDAPSQPGSARPSDRHGRHVPGRGRVQGREAVRDRRRAMAPSPALRAEPLTPPNVAAAATRCREHECDASADES